MEVENNKEHQEPPTKKQNTTPPRESIIEAKSQEVKASEKRITIEVSSDLESSGYNNRTEYSPLSKNQLGDYLTVTSEEEDKLIDIEEVTEVPKVDGDALLFKPNPDSGRCTAPPWLRQMLMPRGKVVII